LDLKRYGPWALIVGGSEGIGAGFARKLAADGFKLVLTARKTGPLEALANELRAGGTEVRTLSTDMSKPDAIDRAREVTDDIEVGLMIYNAGANSVRGAFVELDPEVYRSVIAVNVLGQSEFAGHYGGLMRQRERGGIILTGSGAGYVGTPSLAAYCASKAFSRVLGEALWGECEKFGVDVLHLVIGYTATPAMERLGYDLSTAQDPADAAQEGLDNIRNGPVWHCGGPVNLERAAQQSRVEDRASLVRGVVAPPKK
jgi:short-subunit dehydrogenase